MDNVEPIVRHVSRGCAPGDGTRARAIMALGRIIAELLGPDARA